MNVKIKKLMYSLSIGIFLLLIGVVFVRPSPASADAFCGTISSTGNLAQQTIENCNTQQAAFPSFTFADNKCYTILGDQSLSVQTPQAASCTAAPFNLPASSSSTTPTQCNTVQNDKTNPIACKSDLASNGCTVESGGSNDVTNGCGLINKYVQPLINVLAGAVGIVVTIMIIFGGIQYSMAGGDVQKVTAARHKITNAVLALVTFGLLYVVLQWLIPGGLIK